MVTVSVTVVAKLSVTIWGASVPEGLVVLRDKKSDEVRLSVLFACFLVESKRIVISRSFVVGIGDFLFDDEVTTKSGGGVGIVGRSPRLCRLLFLDDQVGLKSRGKVGTEGRPSEPRCDFRRSLAEPRLGDRVAQVSSQGFP